VITSARTEQAPSRPCRSSSAPRRTPMVVCSHGHHRQHGRASSGRLLHLSRQGQGLQ
jgi:hypothetical protein